MGAMLIWKPARTLRADSRLTAPGIWAGFLAGLMVIIGNPKAILFYLGILPGFFDFGGLNRFDVVAICVIWSSPWADTKSCGYCVTLPAKTPIFAADKTGKK